MDDALPLDNLPAELRERVRSAKRKGDRAIVVADASDLKSQQRASLEQNLQAAFGRIPGVSQVHVVLTADKVHRRIVAIGSGKGGVGKSTLSANLAVALARRGRKVGMVDADIYGPSQPMLLGTQGQKPEARDDKLVPVRGVADIPMLSMGHLVAPGKALAWRGPMAGNALAQLIDAHWGEAELLLVDLPPGTGDVQLTMMQRFKPAGAVIVSTPQDLALMDAARAGQLFEQANIPIIGMVENMSGYVCPHCGEASDPFGAGGIERAAERLDIPFLGRIALTLDIREASDRGNPPAARESEAGAPFHAIADKLVEWLDNNPA